MLRSLTATVICFSFNYCIAQINLSEGFLSDIKSTCPICKLDTSLFNTYKNDDFHLAHYFYTREEIDSSFSYSSKLLSRIDRLTPREIYVLYYLNGLALKQKNLHKASSKKFNLALSYVDVIEKVASIDNIYINLSQDLIEQYRFEDAITILENWKQKEGLNNESAFAAKNFGNLGISYLHIENYQKAEENLLKSHQINLQTGNVVDLTGSSIDLANLYYEQYMDSIAIVYFEEGLAYAKKGDNLKNLEVAYQNMAIVEENREDFKKSLFYIKEYQKIKDSLWNRDRIWELAQTDKAIAAAVNKEKLMIEKSKAKRLLLFASLLLFILALVSYFIYEINKQRKLISKQKDDLEDLHRLKDELFAILGHDLRAPMHYLLSINRQMSLAAQGVKGTPLFDLIGKNALASSKMHLLLDNLLHWVLVKSKKGYFESEKINVVRLVEMVRFNFEALLDHKSITFSTQIEEHLTVYADANSIKVVLRNVLDNAIKFTPNNGHISVEGKKDEDTVTIVIKDNGIGMDTNQLNKLSTSSSDLDSFNRQNTGLGLKLCQSFLKRSNGHFTIESEIGKGTSVFISLPNK
ncbi:MAG: ATP-binding protein [Bacteroidota bacterium]